jgi:hypothetical protein
MKLSPCFRKRMFRIGAWFSPAILASCLLAKELSTASKLLLGWGLAYLLVCGVWWLIIRVHIARRARYEPLISVSSVRKSTAARRSGSF